MAQNRLFSRLPMLLMLSLGCDQGTVGCGAESPYPWNDPDNNATRVGVWPQAARLRLSDSALAGLGESLPPLLAGLCGGQYGAPPEICETDDPLEPTFLRFYFANEGEPLNFEFFGVTGVIRTGGLYPFDANWTTPGFSDSSAIAQRPYCDDTGGNACLEKLSRGLGTDGSGFCRDPGTTGCTNPEADYCCGQAAPHLCSDPDNIAWLGDCTAPRANVRFDYATLPGNVHFSVASTGDNQGIRITLGCAESNLADCAAQTAVRGSLDMTLAMELSLFDADIACYVVDDPQEQASFEIQRFQFVVTPKIVLGPDDMPYLTADDDHIVVEHADLDIFNIDLVSDYHDPACYDEGWSNPLFSSSESPDDNMADCDDWCSASLLPTNFVSTLMTGAVGRALAGTIVRAAVGALTDDALILGMHTPVRDLLPVGHRKSTELNMVLAGHEGELGVSGEGAQAGVNLDVDLGLWAPQSPCVPAILPASGGFGAPPNLGGTVLAPHPTSGSIEPEPYDVALMLAGGAVQHALHAGYLAGFGCIEAAAWELHALTGGAFAPTLEVLQLLIAPMARLGPPETPVDMVLAPTEPATLSLGETSLALSWPGFELGFYPFVDDAAMRSLAVQADLYVALTWEVTPAGDMQLFFDDVDIGGVEVVHDPQGLNVSGNDILGMLNLLLPTLLGELDFTVPLGNLFADLGMEVPIIPKLRALQALEGTNDHYLTAFFRLCFGDLEAGDDEVYQALCGVVQEPGPGDGSQVAQNVWASVALRDVSTATLQLHGQPVWEDELEVAFRFLGQGPYTSFRPLNGQGQLTLEHPWLLMPGGVDVELLLRKKHAPLQWLPTVSVWIEPHTAPPPTGQATAEAHGQEANIPSLREASTLAGGCNAATGASAAYLLCLPLLLGGLRRRRAWLCTMVLLMGCASAPPAEPPKASEPLPSQATLEAESTHEAAAAPEPEAEAKEDATDDAPETFLEPERRAIKPPKIALVLGGGGARGFAHVGVLRVLEREKIPINLVVGTSVGSLIGAIYAANPDTFELEWKAFNLRKEDIFDFSFFAAATGPVKGDAIKAFIAKHVVLPKIEEFKVPFVAVATDLHTGERVDIDSGSVIDAVRASVSIPGVFSPARVNGRTLIDGGVVANIATDVARERGADVVIAVNISENVENRQVHDVVAIILQSINIMMAEMAQQQLRGADVVLTPDIGDVGTMDFGHKKRCMRAGIAAAESGLDAIRGAILRYYDDQHGILPAYLQAWVNARSDS